MGIRLAMSPAASSPDSDAIIAGNKTVPPFVMHSIPIIRRQERRLISATIVSALLIIPQVCGAFTNFITRSGSTIKDGATTFNFVGANMPEVTHLRTDFDLRNANRMRFPTCAEIDYLVNAAAQSNAKVIRTWCFPSVYDGTQVPHALSYFYTNSDGTTVTLNEEAFQVFDYLLATANAKNVRLFVPFLYQWVWAGSDGLPHPQFKNFVSQVLNRVNTITGVAYKNDKAIYAWASGNEFNPSAAWIANLAAYVKGIDSNHLFMDARDNAQQAYDAYYTTTTLLNNTDIDIVSYHLYNPSANGWDAVTTMVNMNTRLATGNKALNLGEISPNASATTINTYTDTVQNNGIHSILYWSWKGIKSEGGYMQWNGASWGPNDDLKWPGFVSTLSGVSTEKDKVDALVSHHYSITGGTRPALPAPLPAHLLPIANPGHISWEPGVGEQAADVERSTNGSTFSTILTGYETFRSGHADMFSDTGAAVGSTYYYRIHAKNSAGYAGYSNVVGPITVANLWLVDDLWDLSKTSSSSGGCVVTSSYDAVPYHCDLSYLSSSSGAQNIIYNVTGNVNQVVVLSSNDTSTLSVQGSVAGSSYTTISLNRTMYPPLHSEFVGHPRILYESGDLTGAGYRYIRINFGASDVISRVEIAHSGSAAPAPTENIVDNSDVGFSTVGSWTASTATSTDYGVPLFMGTNYLHDGDNVAGGSKSATWNSPITSTGTYDVFMRWAGAKNDSSRPDAAPVEINYNGGIATTVVNQQVNPGAWNLLGTWSFTGGSGDYVKITDADAGYTIADAIRWVKIVAYDNFADQNDTGWTKVGGTWSVLNDNGYCYDQSNTSGEAVSTYGSTAWQDYVFDADVKVTGEGTGATGPGLVFRYVDSNNYYLFQLRRPAGVVRLWKKQGGTFSQIGSDVPFTSVVGDWYEMRVELAGTSLRCYVNGCKLMDLLDSTFGAGAIGIRTGNNSARFDNIHVK